MQMRCSAAKKKSSLRNQGSSDGFMSGSAGCKGIRHASLVLFVTGVRLKMGRGEARAGWKLMEVGNF